MDRLFGAMGYSDGSVKPEILVVYGAFALLVTVFVNWALATLLIMLKPFTCAAILLAFIRPDIAQNFLQEESVRQLADTAKSFIFGSAGLLMRLGEQFRQKFQ